MGMFFEMLLGSKDGLTCPWCGERFTVPGVDASLVHAEKKSWFFHTDHPVVSCPRCRESLELVKNSIWSG